MIVTTKFQMSDTTDEETIRLIRVKLFMSHEPAFRLSVTYNLTVSAGEQSVNSYQTRVFLRTFRF